MALGLFYLDGDHLRNRVNQLYIRQERLGFPCITNKECSTSTHSYAGKEIHGQRFAQQVCGLGSNF